MQKSEKKKPPVRKKIKPRAKKKAVAVEAREPVRRPQSTTDKPIRRSYLFAVGRRKTAIARVRLFPGSSKEVQVNTKPVQAYFQTVKLQHVALAPLQLLPSDARGNISVVVTGGGMASQAEAVRLGIARVCLMHDSTVRPVLKKSGFLTRDARTKERKKYGLRRARRAPQWQKR